MTVVRSFFDESGTNPETPVLCVAGSYGTRDEWRKFRNLWEPHSADFHALYCSDRFGLLSDAMIKANIRTLLVSVGKETYKEYATPHFKTALGNAYASCALVCAAELCKQVEPDKLSIVLESGQPNLDFVQGILESMMNSNDWCISAVAKAKKEDFIELHCADFASHICSTYDKPWMGKLFDAGVLLHAHLTKEQIQETSLKVTELFQKAKTLKKALKRLNVERSEFENFDDTMQKLITVPHSEIAARLEAERAAKKGKRKPKKTSASGHASNDKD